MELDVKNLSLNFKPDFETKRWNIDLPCFEQQYVNALINLRENGIEVSNRTGINTITMKHQYFNVKMRNVVFPIIRGKKVYPKLALKELIWMLLGRTDVKWLQDNNVNYWNEWAKIDGTIGPSYGKQFRNFNGVDQLQKLVDGIIKNPLDRRHIINLWNQNDLPDMSLPPCFYDFHFTCTPLTTEKNNTMFWVDLHVRARSEDSFLGMPYDIMFVSWFLLFVTKYLTTHNTTNTFLTHDIHYTIDDFHLYVNHKEQLNQYLSNVEEHQKELYVKQCYLIDDECFDDLSLTSHLTLDEYIQFWLDNIDTIKFEKYFSCDGIKAEVAV